MYSLFSKTQESVLGIGYVTQYNNNNTEIKLNCQESCARWCLWEWGGGKGLRSVAGPYRPFLYKRSGRLMCPYQ